MSDLSSKERFRGVENLLNTMLAVRNVPGNGEWMKLNTFGGYLNIENARLLRDWLNSALPTDEPPAAPTLNEWFLSLPEGRREALRVDKWMLAEAAFEAGKRASTPPPDPHLHDDIEAAYWLFDHKKKGRAPMSERDAFKWVLRGFLAGDRASSTKEAAPQPACLTCAGLPAGGGLPLYLCPQHQAEFDAWTAKRKAGETAADECMARVREHVAPLDNHPNNDWSCKCGWINFGSLTSCGSCEAARPTTEKPCPHPPESRAETSDGKQWCVECGGFPDAKEAPQLCGHDDGSHCDETCAEKVRMFRAHYGLPPKRTAAETVERPFNVEEAKAYGQFIDEAFEKPSGET